MKSWLPVTGLLLFTACHNEPGKKETAPRTIDSLPAPIAELYRSVKQHPDSINLGMTLIDALDSIGDHRGAMAQLDGLIRKDSLNYTFWFRKARIQEVIPDTAGALKSYHYAARIYPSPDVLLSMANLYAEKKNAAALSLCGQVAGLKLGKQYAAHCHFISGVYYARTGSRQKALELFDRCIADDYRYMEAYMEKGFIYFDDKNITAAAKVFETVISLKHTYADGYYWLAKCQEASRNKTEAISNYRQALAIDPNIKEAMAALKRLGAD